MNICKPDLNGKVCRKKINKMIWNPRYSDHSGLYEDDFVKGKGEEMSELYPCPHCGTPTTGKVIGLIGKKPVRTMCQECEDYIGSPAAQQEGATMDNRIEMQKAFKEKK